jgi:hypothetical protein
MGLDEHGTVKGRHNLTVYYYLEAFEYYDGYAAGQQRIKTLRLVVVRSTVRYWGTGSVDVVDATQGS